MASHHHHHHLLDLADPFFPFGPPSSSCPFLAAPAGFGFPSLGLGPLELELELEPFPTLLHDLTDRVAALELAVAARHYPRPSPSRRKYTYVAEAGDRKLRWTAEEKPRGERALKWVAELKSPHPDGFDRKWKWESKSKAASSATKVKWATHLKGKGCLHPWSHAYTWEEDFGATDDDERIEVDKKKKTLKAKEDRKKKKDDKVAVAKEKKCPVAVNIEEIPDDNSAGTVAIRKAFTMGNGKDKRKELSPQDAALLIQLNYRAHLAHRSQVLRCLRDLAVAKAKLKEIRSLFCNISYRRRIAHDHEELQRFSEKIIVLLLTVDALEGPDYMVRTAKKSMLEELEGMLDIVDAQPPGKQRSLSRRKFDLPQGGGISDEKTAGVNNAIRMIDERD